MTDIVCMAYTEPDAPKIVCMDPLLLLQSQALCFAIYSVLFVLFGGAPKPVWAFKGELSVSG